MIFNFKYFSLPAIKLKFFDYDQALEILDQKAPNVW